MNDTENSPSILVKVLVVIGFFATILLLVWVLMFGARHLPGAFASLASLAESLTTDAPHKELTIGVEKNIVNSGESFTISWTDLEHAGTYTFAPLCTEGASVSVRSAAGDLVTVPCTESLSLPADVHGLFLTMHTTAHRFTEVPFTISFESEDKKTRFAESAQVTVVNATVPVSDTTAEVAHEEPQNQNSVVTSPNLKTTTSVPAAPAAPKPVVTTKVISHVPVSDPHGYTDLAVSFVSVGTMHGSTFVPQGAYEEDGRGAFRFMIQNRGTKTSSTWSFTAELPGDTTYTSTEQIPLLPNEQAILTIGFDVLEHGRETTIKIEVDTTHDTKRSNDTLSWSVRVRD